MQSEVPCLGDVLGAAGLKINSGIDKDILIGHFSRLLKLVVLDRYAELCNYSCIFVLITSSNYALSLDVSNQALTT